jgi:hypothetical protein
VWHLSSFDFSRVARTYSHAAHRRAIGAYDRATLPERQRHAELLQRARYWLSRLDPQSAEAQRFASFALEFASPLEAAIAYVRAYDGIK